MDESRQHLFPDTSSGESGAAPDAPRPIPLDGWFERRAFSPLWTTFAALIAAFILFQVIISPLAVVVLLLLKGVSPDALLADPSMLIEQHAGALLTANTIGQVLGLCLPAWWLARMHTRRPLAFLRVRRLDVSFIVPALAALIALMPVVQWLGAVNGAIPLPEVIREFEASQMELIRQVLHVDTNIAFQLIVLALTPALCEELLFRGYVQRQAERSLGAVGGILFSGIVFAIYHLRFSQILPLAALGVFMAYLVWRTGSIWPAIAVHFTNNAVAVAVGAYVTRHPEHEISDIEHINVPWYLVLLGAGLFILFVLAIERGAPRRAGDVLVSETPPGFRRE